MKNVPSDLSWLRKKLRWLARQEAELWSRKSVRRQMPMGQLALERLEGQPGDLWLLSKSALYRRSRRLYRESGGVFVPSLVSSPRTLSSPILLEQRIEYSPIAREIEWSANEPYRLATLRTYSSSLYHEQNHRLLWGFLPPLEVRGAAARRALNWIESLVVIADMALGDELGPVQARLFYELGVIYDPGTRFPRTPRVYRNLLQAARITTYLYLEGYDPRDIRRLVPTLFAREAFSNPKLLQRAIERALRLDRQFVEKTNPEWQRRNLQRFREAEKRRAAREELLVVPADPRQDSSGYLWAERWMDLLGIGIAAPRVHGASAKKIGS